jgi:hypothetical protein
LGFLQNSYGNGSRVGVSIGDAPPSKLKKAVEFAQKCRFVGAQNKEALG